MNYFAFITQDWKANSHNSKGRMILLLFRMANFCTRRRVYRLLGFPYLLWYRFFVEWVLGIEIPWNVQAGRNLVIYHGQGLVINHNVVIGENCVLRHCTTLGNKELADGSMGGAPVLGNYVDVGSNACIIGDIRIGDRVSVGCGAVVIKSIRPDCLAVGNPATERERKVVDKILPV